MLSRVVVRVVVRVAVAAAVAGVGLILPMVAVADPSAAPDTGASGSPSPSLSSSAGPTGSADETTATAMPRTNVQAVVDPIAVRVRDGVRIRVGMRNAGPRSITAPVGTPAVTFNLYIVSSAYINRVRSLGGCGYVAETPPRGDPPVIDVPVSFFACASGRTLRVGETFWQAFVFPDLSGFDLGVTIDGSGYADDPVPADNSRTVRVRLGGSDGGGAPGLPATGAAVGPLAGGGLALIVAGVLLLRITRRHTAGRRAAGQNGPRVGAATHHEPQSS